jgi:hypothetical protein
VPEAGRARRGEQARPGGALYHDDDYDDDDGPGWAPFMGQPRPFMGQPRPFMGQPRPFMGQPRPFMGQPRPIDGGRPYTMMGHVIEEADGGKPVEEARVRGGDEACQAVPPCWAGSCSCSRRARQAWQLASPGVAGGGSWRGPRIGALGRRPRLGGGVTRALRFLRPSFFFLSFYISISLSLALSRHFSLSLYNMYIYIH